jgi:hypothetical protein
VTEKDETPDITDEAESQTTVEAEEEVEKGVAAKPEGGGRIP